jgi:Uma2 family endonuclease
MSSHAKKKSTYEDLKKYPDGTHAELIDGEIRVAPRPNYGHRSVETKLGLKLIRSSEDGKMDIAWLIEIEPEVKFQENIFIPDLAGWRTERRPNPDPMEHLVLVIPDWTCEIISPNSARMDRVEKFKIYLETGVSYYWIVDPTNQTIEAFKNEKASWQRLGAWGADDKARIAPFEELEMDLSSLWMKR